MISILLVEDEAPTIALLSSVLESHGFHVSVAETAAKARAALEKSVPHLVILDRNLPDADGLTLCGEIRQRPKLKGLPVLFLTAKTSTADRVDGLTMGGDDYLVKPFSPAELLARVQAILRRSGLAEMPAFLEAGKLKVDLGARTASVAGKAVDLWAREYDLLVLFLRHRGRALSRDFILQEVWQSKPEDFKANSKIVEATVSNLRAKLGSCADMITAVRGYGYRFEERSSKA